MLRICLLAYDVRATHRIIPPKVNMGYRVSASHGITPVGEVGIENLAYPPDSYVPSVHYKRLDDRCTGRAMLPWKY